jgi:hypothetical protein
LLQKSNEYSNYLYEFTEEVITMQYVYYFKVLLIT